MSDATIAAIRQAWLEHGVLFFRNQKISFDDHAQSMRAS
jgi:alpha-ketoglutarate-dependent taurine dioxygenase